MSGVFDLHPTEIDPSRGITPEQIEPAFFSGLLGSIPRGIGASAVATARFAGILAAAPIRAAGDVLDYSGTVDPNAINDSIDGYFRSVVQPTSDLLDEVRPDPRTTGAAGRVLSSLAEIVVPLLAGGGNPSLLIGSQQINTAADVVDAGAGADAAQVIGAIQGAATGVGFKLPFLGKNLATRMATGAAGNLALNTGTTAAQREILQASGADQAGAQFDPADLTARALDVLTGVAFGGVAHLQMRAADREAVLAANLARHHADDTAPGHPATVSDSIAHQQAINTAIEQTLRGEPVNVPGSVTESTFLPRERTPFEVPPEFVPDPVIDAPNFGVGDFPRTIPDGDPLLAPRDTDATPERVALRQQIIRDSIGDAPSVEGRKPVAILMGGGGASGKGTILKRLQKIGAVPKGAVHVDPDEIKARIPEYSQIVQRGDSRAAATVHEESSALAKEVIAAAISRRSDLVLDRTLANVDKGLAEIEALRAAGYEIKLYGVTVDPAAAVRRADQRARKSGRYVPPSAILTAHKGFAAGFERLAAAVDEAHLMDNEVTAGRPPRLLASGGGGGDLRVIDRMRYNAFVERSKINDQATTIRQISGGRQASQPGATDVGRGSAQGAAQLNAGADARGDAGAGRPARDAADSGGLSGERLATEQAAAQAIEVGDIQLPTGEIGADGKAITRSAKDLLAEIDGEQQRAETEAKGIDAAIQCFLARGQS